MPKSARETVDVTSLIRGILNGYPPSSILREYGQNSDDAQAHSQTFVVDETLYPTTSLVDPVLRDSQGPALIAINDQVFSERDWAAIQNIHASSKVTDESQTGKNGLGFRASYHLTENPHILSGRRLMILDPHQQFKSFPGGVDIDIINEGTNYQDQLAPFIPFIEDSSKYYQGTIFRLPLRTNAQAIRSRIKNESTAVSDIKQLLEGFGKNELEETILFLKNISTIEIRHIPPSGKEYTIGRATIDQRNTGDGVLLTRKVTYEAPVGNLRSRTWRFSTCQVDKSMAAQIMSKRLGYNISDELTNEKLVANVELAIPLGGPSIQGRLFTLLPLPIKTGFPVHLNAAFALTPDRQSLKNLEEAGLPESRERRLVEWNRAVFEDFGPKAWVHLLSDFTVPADFWNAWPPEEHDGNSYWANLIPSIIKLAITSKLSTFPLVSSDGTSSHTALDDDSIFLSPSDPKVSLVLLARLKLMVVQPPAHIFNIFNSGTVQASASILSPTAVHRVLRLKYLNDKQFSVSPSDVAEAVKYLVFSTGIPTIDNVFDLPWFVHQDGSPATLSQWSSRSPHIVPTTEDEAGVLFSSRNDMLSWTSMSPELLSYLAHQAILSTSIRTTNVILLTPDHVIEYLQDKFGGINSSEAEVTAKSTDIDWLVCFWKWVMGWKERAAILTRLRAFHSLHLLPTRHQTIRKISSQIVVFKNVDEAVIAAWTQLGVNSLHSGLSENEALVQILVTNNLAVTPQISSYIGFLVNNFDVSKLVRSRVDAYTTLHRSLYQTQLAIKSTLSSSQKERFSLLPIFHVWQEYGEDSILASISGNLRILVKVDADVPLPLFHNRPPPIYIDVSKPATQTLIEMVASTTVCNELDLLQFAIDNWTAQSSDLQDKFIQRIFDNLPKLKLSSRLQIKNLPFVTVDNSNQPVPPCDLINPSSSLEYLYTGEKGKFPAGKFSSGSYLSMMRVYGFLKSQLDHVIVSERIRYLSHSSDSFDKSKAFVEMLNENWKDAYGTIVIESRTDAWLPSISSKSLVSPSNCRDRHEGPNQHPHLYDLVFDILALPPLRSDGFRKSLGWSDSVSTNVLLRQFSSALAIPQSTGKRARIVTLITHFGQLYAQNKLSAEFLVDLRKSVQEVAWVPVSSSRDPEALNFTKYALLSETKLRSPFRQVHWRDNSNESNFLRAMGCTSRPSLTTLYEELSRLLHSRIPSIDTSIIVLEEIAQHGDYDRAQVLVPSDDNSIYALESVYYPDVPQTLSSTSSLNKSPLHRKISMALAEQLKVPFLSAALLEQGADNDEDEEQMAEDLRDRIGSFLRENDVLYAVNEFLANADDAKATKFSILLDNRRDTFGTRVISSALETLQNSSYIIFYNDAVLSELDFSGLRKVGRGGKSDEIDTHGRHGLGALAFYYFTDTPFVISGEYVMILDPTSRYLPPMTRSGRKRTSLYRKISSIVKQYPDQLKRFENLFGFSSSLSSYDGTMFCLPLNATIPRKSCDSSDCRDLTQGTYRELAQNAFFFTNHLEGISAEERSTSLHRAINLWSMSATRSEKFPLGDQYTRHEVNVNIQVREKPATVQKWIISTGHASIPIEHANTAANLKLPANSNMKVQIALDPHKGEESSSHLFSTLRLPKSNCLPFHLHARFAISSNRQTLIFSADDPKTAFNAWILNDLVPPLYLTSLGYLKHHSKDRKRYDDRVWWLNPTQPPDDITIFVKEAILKFLPSSQMPLFQSAGDKWINFKNAVFSYDEPSIIRDIITRLRLPQLVIAPRHTGVHQVASAMLVDGKYVKKAFNERILELRTILTVNHFPVENVFEILHYIKDEAPLSGLPLLILADKSLAFLPRISERPVYHSAIQSHCDLFSSTPFLHNACSQEIIQALTKDASVNIQVFTDTWVPKLVEAELDGRKDDKARERWLGRFWNEYDGLPGPPPLSLLEGSNLKILKGESCHISLRDCQPDAVVHPMVNADIVAILRKLDINVLKYHSHPRLIEYIDTRLPSLLINVLQCLKKKNKLSFPGIYEDEHTTLAAWLRTEFQMAWLRGQRQLPIEKHELLRLPMWKAQLDGRQQIRPASDLHVLPGSFAITDISSYLSPHIAVASSTTSLPCASLTDYFKPMSPSEILNSVQLPTVLRGHRDCQNYKYFLKSSIALDGIYSVREALKFPDCNGILRVISDLYSRSVPLFAKDLKYTAESSFLHPDFRDLSIDKLKLLGFQHQITFSNFKKCAETVEALSHDLNFLAEPHKRNDLMEMARITFDCYKTTLPALIMINSSLWGELDTIAFVRPKADRRQGASYDVDPSYYTQLPLLIAPSEIIKPEYEPIAWTQCALPHESFSDQVLAVNRSLGIPMASVVVEHLKVLTTKIALRHPGDRTLISDLKATYTWLNENVEDAREALVCNVDIPLFLNVVDPLNSQWDGNWQSASKLVHNLAEDCGTFKAVKPFLHQYECLLLAAGCHELNPLARTEQPSTDILSISVDLVKQFNEMRRKNQLTDLFFEPTIQPAGDDSLDREDLSAHKAFLAATLPYFRDKFELENHGLFQDNQRYTFEGTRSAAKAVLNFIYTGEFEYPEPSDRTERIKLLDDYLGLLSVAEEWDMSNLKAKITSEIVANNFIQRLPQKFPTILEAAELYHAEELERYLKDFKEHNGRVLDMLIQVDKSGKSPGDEDVSYS